MSYGMYPKSKPHDPVRIGNSGFEYVKIDGARDKWGGINTFTFNINDSNTKETLFGMSAGTEYYGRGVNNSGSNNLGGTKTILGKDEKYYYLSTLSGSLQWGIVQTSGIVLRKDRSVLTTIKMHPLYQTAPAVKIIPEESSKTRWGVAKITQPIVPVNKGVIGTKKAIIQSIPDVVPAKTESLLTRLINWIERVLRL